MKRRIPLLVAVAVAAGAAFAFAVAATGGTGTKPGKRVIYLSAVEWKGSADVAKEPYPTTPLPKGGGYERFPPDATGKWSVETYRFDSAMVAACKGEKVTLNVFGVNAPFHDISIPAYNVNFRVWRGKLAKVTFVVRRAGIFPIICRTHQPSHRADLLVLPVCA